MIVSKHCLKIAFILLSFLAVPFFINAQNDQDEILNRQRAIFIFNVAEQIQGFDLEGKNVFNIGVLGNNPIISDLNELGKTRKIKKLNTSIKVFPSIESIANIDLLYVNKNSGFGLEQILPRVTGNNSLLISENFGFNQSMINIIIVDQTIEFELNDSRLTQENFKVPQALQDHAISSAEIWQEMYVNTEKALQEERRRLQEQSEKLKEKQQELEDFEVLYDAQQDLLFLQANEMADRKLAITSLQEDYKKRSEILNTLEKNIIEKEALLDSQQKSIANQKVEFLRMDSILSAQGLQIEQQKGQLNVREQQLALERRFNYLLITLAGLFLISSFIIYRGYRQNKKSNKELVELNKQKNELIGIVAHDLRSPINQMKGLANLMLLSQTDLNSESKLYVEQIINSCDRLTGMIRRILDVNAIESKKINLEIERVNLNELLNQTATNFKVLADKKSIAIHEEYPKQEVLANVDRNYLLQVIENLVSNAIKFSEKAKNIFLVSGRENGSVYIAVKDEGPGISQEDQKRLFGQFQQLAARPTDGEESHGLGLSISKKYVEAMQGDIICESTVGRGTTFKLLFQNPAV